VVINNLARAHLVAYRQIKKIYQESFLAEPQISIAKHLREFISYHHNPYYRLAAGLKDYFFNFWLLNKLWRRHSLDFLGVNYYTVDFIPAAKGLSENLSQSNLNWPIYPQGLFNLLLRLRRYQLPVFILENGISTDNDALRWNFIQQHLESVYQAMQQGVKIIGYLYWSLLDNFEWEKGFRPHFGLVEVDYQTFKRNIRASARSFARICAWGELDNGH
jgi:beta-glucosidase